MIVRFVSKRILVGNTATARTLGALRPTSQSRTLLGFTSASHRSTRLVANGADDEARISSHYHLVAQPQLALAYDYIDDYDDYDDDNRTTSTTSSTFKTPGSRPSSSPYPPPPPPPGTTMESNTRKSTDGGGGPGGGGSGRHRCPKVRWHSLSLYFVYLRERIFV